MRTLRRSIQKSSLAQSLGRALGVGLIFTSGIALAQSTEQDIALESLDVRGQRRDYRLSEPSLFRFPDLLKDTPQSITVIPQGEIREQATFSMREALRT